MLLAQRSNYISCHFKWIHLRFTNNDGTNANSSVCALYENSISVSGLSKAYGLPGLRIGWTCTRNKEIYNMMWNLKDYITICPAAPSEVLASIGMFSCNVFLFNI